MSKLRLSSSRRLPTTSVVKANTIMNAVTSIAQANSGMRLSVMPGARNLRMLMMISMPGGDGRDLGDAEPEDPEVEGQVGRVPGQAERRVGEPAGVRARRWNSVLL